MNFTQKVIIALMIVALIGYVVYFIGKNKEKIKNVKNKIKNIKIPKWLKNKKIIVSIIVIILTIIIFYVGMSVLINIVKKEYNNDLSMCYKVIKNELDFEKFNSIIDKHSNKKDFSYDAYKKLYQAIDERIENIKNGNDDDELISMIKEIKEKNPDNTTITNKYLKAIGYTNINKANQYTQEQKYMQAYDLLGTVIKDNKNTNKEVVDSATNKQNEIKEQMLQEVISQAQEKINNQDYSSVKTFLEKYKDFGNQTIVDMYNNATNELNRIEAEKKAKEEEERKAREKKEAEEKAKREKKEAEEKAKREAEEKARKKREGVTIGMTQQDVLDSMWGKPQSVNRTVTSGHVYEQWVYGYPNYLYFTDGILTSIQN